MGTRQESESAHKAFSFSSQLPIWWVFGITELLSTFIGCTLLLSAHQIGRIKALNITGCVCGLYNGFAFLNRWYISLFITRLLGWRRPESCEAMWATDTAESVHRTFLGLIISFCLSFYWAAFCTFIGKHRKHPGGRGNAGGQHHHRINFDKLYVFSDRSSKIWII